MRKVTTYLKERWRMLPVFAGAGAVFSVVGLLCRMETGMVGYAWLLSGTFLLFFLTVDFLSFRRKERYREEMLRKISYADPAFPAPQTLAEEQYQKMLRCVLEQKHEMECDLAEQRQESLDYYSLWAHQIKTPLAAMGLLLQEQEGEKGGKDAFLKQMDRELFRTEQYVEMVLGYLRIGDVSRDMVLSWYSLDDLVRQAVRKYARLFILQKIRLVFRESGCRVLTDEKWLVFVLEQLLSNALKYTKKGTVSVYAAKNNPETVTLVVEDTGIGIDPEDVPRVFERGFTGYNGRAYKKSTGIGLYLCRKIMDRLGHKIRIESQPGKGTRVSLELGRRPIQPE